MDAPIIRAGVLSPEVQMLTDRLSASEEAWRHAVSELLLAVRDTHRRLYEPQNGHPPLEVRIDRLEQANQRHDRAWLLFVGAALGMIPWLLDKILR